MLEIRLFGTFDVRCDGKPVIISSRPAQSLFAHLILNPGVPHRREKLAGMLWPDATEEKARAYLRHEIWRIRKALASHSIVDYLSADAISVSFNPSAEYWMDASTLANLSDQASCEELMNALSLFQRELLPGFYEDWAILEREHLQALYEKNMARLLELLERGKRWNEMLEWAERWIILGQRPQAAYRALMVAYSGLGDRSGVIVTYQRSMHAFAELGLEPSEELRALAFKAAHSLNIPIPLTSFIGREKERKEVAGLLLNSRLVTLTGSGGVGKTRLAIEVAGEVLEMFPDGVWLLDLAPLSDPGLVPHTLASLLGLRESRDTKVSITDLLINYLRSRTALVIFDNCEHLIESSAHLADSLLRSCQTLHILATGREALRVPGEIPYRVPSLAVPGQNTKPMMDAVAKIDSVRLFVERAGFASPGFALGPHNVQAIAQICRRLDGIPLAIELAAARAHMLTVDQIVRRLDDRFSLLSGGSRTSLPRHQTLHSTIEWSYDLLSEKERLLFRRLAVFVGGWTLEAAEEVCSGNAIESSEILDVLSRLVNKSLVFVESQQNDENRLPLGASIRYRRLESIRQFAREKLFETGEAAWVQDRHLDFFLRLAEEAEPNLSGREQVAWLDLLERENDNLRAAFDWALKRDTTAAFQLAGAQGWFWYLRGHLSEGLDRLQRALAQPAAAMRTAPYAKALDLAGLLLLNLGRAGEARSLFEEVFVIWRDLNDQDSLSRTMRHLGVVLYRQGDPIMAQSLLREALSICRSLGVSGKHNAAWTLAFLGVFGSYQGDDARANIYYAECEQLARAVGDLNLLAFMLRQWGFFACNQGHYDHATARFRESLELNIEVMHKQGIAASLAGLGCLAAKRGFATRAIRLFGAVQAILASVGYTLLDGDALEYEKNLSAARAQVDETAFDAAWARGRSMTFEQVCSYALED